MNELRWKPVVRLLALLATSLSVAGCKGSLHQARNDQLRTLVLEFASAANKSDTNAILGLSLDRRTLADAARLRHEHSRALKDPGVSFTSPYYTIEKGDTAIMFMYLNDAGRHEFGTEFRRVSGKWLIVRTGIPPE